MTQAKSYHKAFIAMALALLALCFAMTSGNTSASHLGGFRAGSNLGGDAVARFLADVAHGHGNPQAIGVHLAPANPSATVAGSQSGHRYLDSVRPVGSSLPVHARGAVQLRPEQVGASAHYFYDSASPSAIPHDTTDGVAGYVNGYAWSPQEFASFPHAFKIRIDARGDAPWANALDVEIGAAPMSSARAWAAARNAQGYWAVIYGARATVVNLRPMLAGLHVHYWVADPSGPLRLPRAAAVQYLWAGNAYDKSYTPLTLGQLFGKL
jgi:hypothetical protein